MPIKATHNPATISEKKCAPTTILLKATRHAKKINRYFILGSNIDKKIEIVKIVEAWPDGKEWKFELKLKKLNSATPSKA